MTNDELLALYLDNALTSEQRQVFDARLQTSPELSQEVRELIAIQSMLVFPEADDEKSAAFLRNMENHIAATMLGAGAAAATSVAVSAIGAKSGLAASSVGTSSLSASALGSTSAATTGLAAVWASVVTTFTSSVVGASIGAATILGGGAATYYVLTKSASQPVVQQSENIASQQTTAQSLNNTSTAEPLAQVNTSSVATNEQQSTQTASSAAGATSSSSVSSLNAPPSKVRENEYSARISGGAATKGQYAASIQEYSRQLHEKEVAGDRIGSALVEKSLGALLRQAGQFADSRQYLRHSLATAQELKMKELEGEAMGELGLLLIAEGKKSQAEPMLRDAVTTLTAAQSRSLERWQRELDKIVATK
jgi:hypothetical protein